MLSNGCGCGGHDGSLSFNQRLKALEKAIAGYTDLVASDIVKANKAEIKEADIRDADIDKAAITSAEIDILKSDNIQAKFGSFDTIVAGSLNLTDPDVDVEYKNITAENVDASFIQADEATFGSISADYLNVKGLMDMFNMKRLFINGKKALTNESTDNNNALTIGEDFRQADFMTSLRPSWQGLPLALQSDVAGVFSLQGIVASDADLPSNPTDNDVYFIQQHQDATIGIVPAMALYNNGSWGFINYPGLDAYLTKSSYLDDMQSLSHRLDTDESNIQGLVSSFSSLNASVTDLETDYTDHKEKQEEKEAEVDDRLTELETKTDELSESKLDDAPSDGHFYGRKDGEWSTIEDSGTFVNSEYSDDDVESSIKNNADGISFTSTKPIKVSTSAFSKTMSKDVVNVEYLRSNLNLSRQAGETDSAYKLTFKADKQVYRPLWISSRSEYNAIYKGQTKTANYVYVYGSQGRGSNTWVFVKAIDKEGDVKDLETASLQNQFSGASNGHTEFIGYHQDQYSSDTQDTVYLPCTYTGRILCYKDGEFYGEVHEGENYKPYPLDNTRICAQLYTGVSGKGLRGAKRILFSNYTTDASDRIKAFIVGVDDDILNGKSVTLAGAPTYGHLEVAAGKNYWWVKNADTNQFQRIGKDGGVASFIAQTSDGTALPSNLKSGRYSYLEMENGDVMFFVNDVTNYRSYAILCSDSNDDNPIEAIQLPVFYAATASSTGVPFLCDYPAFECNNYIYVFQTYARALTTIDETNSAYTQGNAKTYTRIDKVSHAVTALTTPWSQGSHTYNFSKVKTKGNYTWVFPWGDYDASNIQNLVLVFDPNGNSSTVDLGVTTNFFGATGLIPYSLHLHGSPSWNSPVGSSHLVGVDNKGTGIAISPDLLHVLVFRGDGEFRIFDYDTTSGLKDANVANSTAVAQQGYHMVLIPMDKGFALEYLTSLSLTSNPAVGDNSVIVYITDESTDDALVEPKYKRYNNEGKFYLYPIEKDYTKRIQKLSSVLVIEDPASGIYGFNSLVEVPEGTTGSTIFLRDGDVNISNVSV